MAVPRPASADPARPRQAPGPGPHADLMPLTSPSPPSSAHAHLCSPSSWPSRSVPVGAPH